MSNRQPDGIYVDTTVEVDHWNLGHWLASCASDDQAQFLHGLQIGLQEMGTVDASRQIDYIRASAEVYDIDLSELAAMLNDHRGEDPGVTITREQRDQWRASAQHERDRDAIPHWADEQDRRILALLDALDETEADHRTLLAENDQLILRNKNLQRALDGTGA